MKLFPQLLLLLTLPVIADAEFISGVSTHFSQHKGSFKQNFRLLEDLRIDSLRDEAPWSETETVRGQLQLRPVDAAYLAEATARGIQPLTILAYSNELYDQADYPRSPEAIAAYRRYGETVISAGRGQSRIYQIWNEWDGGCGMPPQFRGQGDAESYLKLLQEVYPAWKKLDPSATFLSTSVCQDELYLESLLKLGLLQYCDAVSFHLYNYNQPGELSSPEIWFERVANLDQLLRKYNDGKPVALYLTETGWPDAAAQYGSTPEQSAANLARIHLLGRTLPHLRGIWYYDFQNDGDNRSELEHNFGLVRTDLTPKPAYYVFRDLNRSLKGSRFIERIDAGDPGIFCLHFMLDSGKDLFAMWSAHPGDDEYQLICRYPADGAETFTVRSVGREAVPAGPGFRDWAPRRWSERPGVELQRDKVSFTLNTMPLLVEGKIGSLKPLELRHQPRPVAGGKNAATPTALPRFAAIAVRHGRQERQYHARLGTDYRAIGKTTWGGIQDISFSFRPSYDTDHLYLTIEVIDDHFEQNFAIREAWRGDSLQLAFRRSADGAPAGARSEVDVALTPNGPEMFRRTSQSGLPSGPFPGKAEITRDGNLMRYELVLPLSELGFEPLEPGTILGFSMLVNDNDGDGRKGYMRWGDGIGHSKNPDLYNLLIMD